MRILLRLVVVILSFASCAVPDGASLPFDPVPASFDESLAVTSAARIEQGFSMGVWEVARDGTILKLSRQMLIGDESASTLNLVLEFSTDAITLIDAYRLRSAAELPTTRDELGVSSIVLNNADPASIISGRVLLQDATMLDFWVDVDDASIVEPELDVPFTMQPGFVIDGSSFAVQYIGVVDDSRCPAEVTCVWAGEVTLEFSYVDEDSRTQVKTRGIATPNGPAYGDSPTVDLEGPVYLEVLNVTDQAALVVMRTSEG